MWKPDICIYHHPCTDGFGSAWAVWKKWGDDVEYLPCSYGGNLPLTEVLNKNVLVCDFSWKAGPMRTLIGSAKSVVILDHHVSAKDELTKWAVAKLDLKDVEEEIAHREDDREDKCLALFDMDRSGAMMTWEFCHPGICPPKMITHIQDRDLWQFKYNSTRPYFMGLSSQPMDFKIWDWCNENYEVVLDQGAAIKRYYDARVQEVVASATRGRFLEWDNIPMVNANYFLGSDVGNILAEDAPFALVWNRKGNITNVSLRSKNDVGLDVSKIAERFGGGGHKHAAGFRVEGYVDWIDVSENDEIEKLKTVLRANLRDFELVNNSGLWQGHPFTHALRDIKAVLKEEEEIDAQELVRRFEKGAAESIPIVPRDS